MKAIVKGLIIGLIVIVIGAAILITALALNGWTFKKPEFVNQTFTATEDNTVIKIDVGAGAVKTEFSDGDKIQIDYPSATVFTTEINEANGVFSYKSKIKWALFWKTWSIPDTVIKLPQNVIFDLDFEVNAGTVNVASGSYGKVDIEVNAGTLTVNSSDCSVFKCDVSAGLLSVNDVSCDSFDCEVSAGKLDVSALKCPDIKADVSAGTIILGIDGVKAEYTISASKSAGSCNVSNQTGNTEKSLRVEVSAGSINVNFSN